LNHASGGKGLRRKPLMKLMITLTQWKPTCGRQSGLDSKITNKTPIGTVICFKSSPSASLVRLTTRPTFEWLASAICFSPAETRKCLNLFDAQKVCKSWAFSSPTDTFWVRATPSSSGLHSRTNVRTSYSLSDHENEIYHVSVLRTVMCCTPGRCREKRPRNGRRRRYLHKSWVNGIPLHLLCSNTLRVPPIRDSVRHLPLARLLSLFGVSESRESNGLAKPCFVASATSALFASVISSCLANNKSAMVLMAFALSLGCTPWRIRLPIRAINTG